jgi:hypothetical protein
MLKPVSYSQHLALVGNSEMKGSSILTSTGSSKKTTLTPQSPTTLPICTHFSQKYAPSAIQGTAGWVGTAFNTPASSPYSKQGYPSRKILQFTMIPLLKVCRNWGQRYLQSRLFRGGQLRVKIVDISIKLWRIGIHVVLHPTTKNLSSS